MKKIVLALLALLTGHLFADGPVVGQKVVQKSLVTWSAASGNWSNKTRLLFHANNVYVDTSSTGQAGQWKRVDNTADSCSNPFLLAADTNGATRGVWENRLWLTVRSVDKDSSTTVYHVQTRERVYDGTTKTVRWTPWTVPGKNAGYVDVSIVDSVTTTNASVVSKIAQYGLYHVAGSWARLCPDDNVNTANATGDSVFNDSLLNFTR